MLKSIEQSRLNSILFFIILISIILYFGRELFVIIIFSVLLAMLMTPVSVKLEGFGVSRVFSSLLSVLIIVGVITGVVVLLSAQVANIAEDFPQIKARMEEAVVSFESWLNSSLGISSETLEDKASDVLSNAGGFITGMVAGTFSFIGSFVLVLVFTFLFLLKREKYGNFIAMFYNDQKKRDEASKMIGKISKIAQQYLGGRLISMFILAILYVIGFTVIGLKNAVLLASLAAIMTFIPYIGPFLGGFIPFIMAILDGSLNMAFWVVVIISLAQLFDNYFIEPYVVGGSVNISPFFTIFILILGGVVWGIAGVILFLPLLGIIKIICENVEGLQPYAYLIGDQKDSSAQVEIWHRIKRLFPKRKKR